MITISLDGKPIGEVKRLAVQPDDVIVIEATNPLPMELVDRMRLHLDGVFPGHKVLVLDRGMTLRVATPAERAATDG